MRIEQAIATGEGKAAQRAFCIFSLTHTLWMFGNHKPRISGTDEGIWRRIKLIPFEYKIPDEDVRDQSEMKKEFQKEFSGILNWAIDGYQKYKKEGGINN